MPGKKSGKKKKGKKKKKQNIAGNETAAQVVKRVLKAYEKNCAQSDCNICPGLRSSLKDSVENDRLLAKFIVERIPGVDGDDIPISIEPLLAALRQERYNFLKELYIWEIPLKHENVASLALLLEKVVYPVKHLELMDCSIKSYPLERLALSFNVCETLGHIVLDYNEFGDDGCCGLCKGMMGNKSITAISMNYCGLTVSSGHMLGNMLCTTAVCELFLDGNDLGCEGVVELIKLCAEHAEVETFQREEEEKRKLEEKALASQQDKGKRYISDGEKSADEKSLSGSMKGKKKKKGKRKKKKKKPPGPPPVGPWIHKLHLADNGIDCYGDGKHLAPLICMRVFRKLITHSKCLQELDLEDNLIGDLGGREILEALQDRKEVGLPSMKARTTHRLNPDIFNSILKLGAGLKKKKKRKGKKKKK